LPEDNYRNRLKLHGINCLNNITQEARLAPVWCAEQLTTEPKDLSQFIAELTREKVCPSADWASAMIAKPRMNSHSDTSTQPAALDEWVVEAIRRIVEPRAWEIYAELGYRMPEFL
jgi:hypothetical protein